MDPIDAKLGKIIQLAKHGVGGEKTNALRLVISMCEKYGLHIDDVMNADEPTKRFVIKYKSKRDLTLICGIASKLLDQAKGFMYNAYLKELYVDTTTAKYVELQYAVGVYLEAYKRERRKILKDIPRAFAMKHQLWAESSEPGQIKNLKQFEEFQRRQRLAGQMEDVHINKALGGGK